MSKRPLPVEQGHRHRVLDPCTLGRPFHLLEEFKQRLRRLFQRHLGERFNHRHGADFQLGAVAISAARAGQDDAAWRNYEAAPGLLSVRLDRRLLLAMLGYHYGDAGVTPIDEQAMETETEQRFGASVGQSLLEVFAGCLAPVAAGGFASAPTRPPMVGERVIRFEVEERRLGLSGQIDIALSEAWLALVFAHAVPRRASAAIAGKVRAPLPERLPITLSVRMLTREVLLDDVMRLAPGDVMPMRLPDTADVLVGDTRLFQAVVAEHNGTLCLTSLESAE